MSTMTPTPTAAELRDQLDRRRARLETLQEELNAIPAVIAEQRTALGRAFADGESEAALKKIRARLAELESERSGLESAVELVRSEADALEAEWRPLHAAELEAEADRLEEAYREKAREVERELKQLATRFAPTFEAMMAASRVREQARREALSAAGADREDVFRARPKDGTPAAWYDAEAAEIHGSSIAWQRAHNMFSLAHQLATHGRADTPST